MLFTQGGNRLLNFTVPLAPATQRQTFGLTSYQKRSIQFHRAVVSEDRLPLLLLSMQFRSDNHEKIVLKQVKRIPLRAFLHSGFMNIDKHTRRVRLPREANHVCGGALCGGTCGCTCSSSFNGSCAALTLNSRVCSLLHFLSVFWYVRLSVCVYILQASLQRCSCSPDLIISASQHPNCFVSFGHFSVCFSLGVAVFGMIDKVWSFEQSESSPQSPSSEVNTFTKSENATGFSIESFQA